MRVLLDTHAFLWFVLDDPRLGTAARGLIEDETTDVLVSPASFWEIAIKVSLGKYELTVPFEAFRQQGIGTNGFEVLPVEVRHAAVVATLPFHHKDPFDRLIVAQALAEAMPLVSGDAAPDAYGVRRIR